jgi:hypothetical protein
MDFFPHDVGDFAEKKPISKLPMVYVLTTRQFEYIKIGRTKHFKQRMRNIQSGCPFFLSLWLAIKTTRDVEIEKHLHNELSHVHVRGEWFEPKEKDLDYLISFFDLTNKNVKEVSSALL